MEAELALARRQPRRALELLGAMQRAADPSDLELAWQLSFGVGRSARALGQDAVAERHLSAALDTLEELARRTALTTTRAYFVADRRAVPQTLAAWRRSRGDVAGAFEVAERSRTAVIRALASVSQLERLAAPERAAWERLAAQYFGERERLERTQSAGELLGAEARVAWQAERGQRRAALAETFERLVAMVDTASTPALPRVTAAEVSAALAPGQALLLLEPTRTGTAAYWLTRDELVYVERPSGPPWTAIEARLASIDHLFVVGAARPSALSTWSPGGGPPLGERVGISHLPHAGTLLAPRRSGHRRRGGHRGPDQRSAGGAPRGITGAGPRARCAPARRWRGLSPGGARRPTRGAAVPLRGARQCPRRSAVGRAPRAGGAPAPHVDGPVARRSGRRRGGTEWVRVPGSRRRPPRRSASPTRW
jgi:hypothetical protein